MEEVVTPPPRVDETVGTEMHPLENPVVLQRLFELMPFNLKDFKWIRLVSRAWHNVTLSTWRKNVWLILRDADEDESDDSENVEDDEAEEVPGITRQKYLDLLDNEQLQLVQHPFRKYSLRRWRIDLRSLNQDGEQDQIRFWNRIGPLMTHLDLTFCNFAWVADFRTVIFETTSNLQSLKLKWNVYNSERPAKKEQRLDPKLPQHAVIPAEQIQNNLMELEIHLLDDDDDDEYNYNDEPPIFVKSFPITWMELIIHFPNIKKFGPLEVGETAEAELVEFFESVEILRKERGPGYLAHLSDLDLTSDDDAFPGALVSSINRLNFPLKRLNVTIDETVDEETFKQLLQHPFEYLIVYREPAEHTRPFPNFPFGLKFMALKELSLWGCIAPNLVFLMECTNLEQFNYSPEDEDGYEADLTQGLNDGNHTKLEKLTDLALYCKLGTEQIRKLGELIPNVKKLHIGLDDGCFRAVCVIWKELEHLQIYPWQIGEEALLGKDAQSGEKFCHPNITDLKQLKTFGMEFKGHRHGFTDAMILDGLLALPNLQNVYQICVSSQASPYARSQLKLKFPQCYVRTLVEDPAGGNEFAVAAAEFQQNLHNNSAADSR